MRCNACNKVMQPGEIKFNSDMQRFEVCSECLHIVRDMMEGYAARDRAKERGEHYGDDL
jgi:hypothetical protein